VENENTNENKEKAEPTAEEKLAALQAERDAAVARATAMERDAEIGKAVAGMTEAQQKLARTLIGSEIAPADVAARVAAIKGEHAEVFAPPPVKTEKRKPAPVGPTSITTRTVGDLVQRRLVAGKSGPVPYLPRSEWERMPRDLRLTPAVQERIEASTPHWVAEEQAAGRSFRRTIGEDR
jgi:hypothetical protein